MDEGDDSVEGRAAIGLIVVKNRRLLSWENERFWSGAMGGDIAPSPNVGRF